MKMSIVNSYNNKLAQTNPRNMLHSIVNAIIAQFERLDMTPDGKFHNS